MNVFQQLLRFLLALFKSGGTSNSRPAAPEPPVTAKPSIPTPTTEPAGPSTEKPAAAAPTLLTDEPAAEKPQPAAEAPQPVAEEPLQPLPVEIREVQRAGKTILVVTNGRVEARFKPFKRGLYTIGDQTALDFIEKHPEKLKTLQLSPSAINVMRSVSENEGNLDAINTWDNAFLTFGMFQWTIGAGDEAGELPALLRRLKELHPDAFRRYFGVHGLDVSDETGNVYGFLTLDGTPVKASSRKEPFRSAEWAFRFWLAGQDPDVMATEIEHAINRLKTFYWKQKHSVEGHPIAEIITSEYGVALILDNHVNRPGYVDNCLRLAVKQASPGKAPAQWTTADERKVIDVYLSIRSTYGKHPMTDANQRARVTRRYLDQGLLSAERGSFVYDAEAADRGIFGTDAIGIPPTDYHDEAYDEIKHYDRQVEEFGVEELP